MPISNGTVCTSLNADKVDGQDAGAFATSIDTGGTTFSTGGSYTLASTISQSDAGELSGGAYSLTGGFAYLPGDCDADGDTDLDDFVPFAGCLRGPGGGLPNVDCGCFDYDDSGDIDSLDFAEFQDRFEE